MSERAQGAKAETVRERLAKKLCEIESTELTWEEASPGWKQQCYRHADAILPIFEQELADRDRTTQTLREMLVKLRGVFSKSSYIERVETLKQVDSLLKDTTATTGEGRKG